MQAVQRGIHVFNTLFADEPQVQTAPKQDVSFRDPELIAKRNAFLFHRFYYKSKIQRKLYFDCLTELKDEVFLSTIRLQKIIQENGPEILSIKNKRYTVADFKRMYPWVNW